MSKLTYCDFEIRIEKAEKGGGKTSKSYPVEARSDVGGEALGRFRLPFTRQKLARIFDEGIWLDQEEWEEMGKKLYDALFNGAVHSLFETSFRLARAKSMGLRIKFKIQAPELVALPWEMLRRSDVNTAIARSELMPLVRYIDLPYPAEPLKIEGKLRVLIVSTNPEGTDKLDLEKESQFIEQAFKPLEQKVEVHRLNKPSKIDLYHELRRREYHIVHFMVHGLFNSNTDQGLLLLEDEQGKPAGLNEEMLDLLFTDSPATKVIVFNACQSGKTSHNKTISGVAASVVQAGVPAVVSMQYSITDMAAIYFSKEFYLCLAEGYGIDQAVSQARKALVLQYEGTNEWITPVLHMRAPDGLLFEGQETGILHYGKEADLEAQSVLEKVFKKSIPPPSKGKTHDLNIQIGPLHNGKYPVSVTESPAGTAKGELALPDVAPFLSYAEKVKLDEDERRQFADHIKQLGGELFSRLFEGDIKQAYDDSIVKARAGSLRIRITSETPDMDSIPWESLYDTEREHYIAAIGSKSMFRRQVTTKTLPAPYEMRSPLRVLFATCNPLDLPPLDLEREINWFDSSIKEEIKAGRIEVEYLKDPTTTQIIDKLQEQEFHVFHFAGYDSYAISGGKYDEGIVLLDDAGQRDYVAKNSMMQMLRGFDSIRLVVANTCYTAQKFAPSLVKAGIPSVIGMRYFVDDEVAIRFTKAFYRFLLLNDLRVDSALAETRRILFMQTENQMPGKWAFPTLYTSVPGDDFFNGA